jgi:hypothetical protein
MMNRAPKDSAGDLDELAIFDRQRRRRKVDVDVHRPFPQQVACVAAEGGPSDQASPAARLAVEVEVFGHGQRRDNRRLLIDARDTSPPAVPVGQCRSRLSFEQNLTGVWGLQAGEDVDESRLARPVPADQRVGATGSHADACTVQRLRGSVRFGDVRRQHDGPTGDDRPVGGGTSDVAHESAFLLLADVAPEGRIVVLHCLDPGDR